SECAWVAQYRRGRTTEDRRRTTDDGSLWRCPSSVLRRPFSGPASPCRGVTKKIFGNRGTEPLRPRSFAVGRSPHPPLPPPSGKYRPGSCRAKSARTGAFFLRPPV